MLCMKDILETCMDAMQSGWSVYMLAFIHEPPQRPSQCGGVRWCPKDSYHLGGFCPLYNLGATNQDVE